MDNRMVCVLLCFINKYFISSYWYSLILLIAHTEDQKDDKQIESTVNEKETESVIDQGVLSARVVIAVIIIHE